jgi:hypothetical protein
MRKIGLAALVAAPLVAGCYAETYPADYYARPSYVSVYGPPSVYVAPRPVYVAPPRPVYVAPRAYVAPRVRARVYW